MKTFIEIKHYEEGEPHTWTFTALFSSNRYNSKAGVLFLVQWKAAA